MTITLPRLPRTAEYEIRQVEVSDVQRSTNGVALPITRTGDHFEIEVDVGSLSPICARDLTVDLLQGRGQRIRVLLPQQGIDTGAPGAVVVDGAGQGGTSLLVRGGTPRAVIRKGWHLTVITDGIGRLLWSSAEVILDGAGAGTLQFWPMLRVPPADGDTVEISEPFLEGFRSEGGEMSSGLVKAARPGSFVIEEAE